MVATCILVAVHETHTLITHVCFPLLMFGLLALVRFIGRRTIFAGDEWSALDRRVGGLRVPRPTSVALAVPPLQLFPNTMHTIFGGTHYAARDPIINPAPTSLTPWEVVTKRGGEEWWPE